MTALLDEARRFLDLAAHDLAAFRALADLPHIRQAVAIFHAQQSVEKSLKAVYFVRGMEFRRTHDLLDLAGRLEQAGVRLPFRREELGALNPYAVEFRYDDPIALTLDKAQVDHIAGQTLLWANALVSESGNE